MPYEDEHFVDASHRVWNYSLFREEDIIAFRTGNMLDGYEKFGSHQRKVLGKKGFYFAVWAPNATEVFVIGDFNGWNPQLHPLFVRLDGSGIWEGFIPGISAGQLYKYHIKGYQGIITVKADPYAKYAELRPGTASITWDIKKKWKDRKWMNSRKRHNALEAPWSVYELHLGSWMRPVKHDENAYLSYGQIAERLIPYIQKMGYTHVEFMPVMEYPFDGSWGYQGAGYFAATSRFGKPEELMELIDQLHQHSIGVILDWVPSHFPGDAHGLFEFDGAHTYEYADMRKGYHPDWNSFIFNYARKEVISFLLSSAHFWMDFFHADGLRVDAVNSMIRLDFSRKPGEWEPNQYGGNENVEAIEFLRKLNVSLYEKFEGIQTIAEEASDWPGITMSPSIGGFGFGMKWMMGWMHDSFRYFKRHPMERPNYQNELSFSMMYFYDEHFILPLSHDEVVHGKSPMIYKMPGNEWEKYAHLRLLYAYMMMHPGAKLNFMGNEFGQTSEWNYKSELHWELLQFEPHAKLQTLVSDLNHLYKNQPALFQYQFDPRGFQWESLENRAEGVLIFRRMGKRKTDDILVVMNVSVHNFDDWHVRVKGKKSWRELLNTNDIKYWGSGWGKNLEIPIEILDKKKAIHEIKLHIPALSILILG